MLTDRPNLLFVMSDDHAAHAISAYGSIVNRTPHIDRIADEGMRFDNAFCTNSICSPSRASILTGTYSHVNGVTTTIAPFNADQPTFPELLQQNGYQTAVVGKWHIGHGPGHDPHGFDHWEVLPGQGDYFDPVLFTRAGPVTRSGYVTDLITELAVDWLDAREPDRPFCLLVHHKAPHRPWEPHPRHADLYTEEIPLPATFDDDYADRGAAAEATMRVSRDLGPEDLKVAPPPGLSERERALWNYQRYMSDYLRCVAAVDENVGRLLDYLDTHGLTENTVVIYTSDQGFFLGDHGWYDKRFMYEESLRMPLLVRYPGLVERASERDELVTNVDFAQTLLDLAGVSSHPRMQGRSLLPLLGGERPTDWRDVVYYRYWEHLSNPHRVGSHYGIRTKRHKLICYYGQSLGQPGAADEPRPPEWELFDLVDDPAELHNRFHDPTYADTLASLTDRLAEIQADLGDKPQHTPRR
ncbi:MAG: sulfatase family protein [Micromonosporaceae bacterium]